MSNAFIARTEWETLLICTATTDQFMELRKAIKQSMAVDGPKRDRRHREEFRNTLLTTLNAFLPSEGEKKPTKQQAQEEPKVIPEVSTEPLQGMTLAERRKFLASK